MTRMLVQILLNGVALFVASKLVPGIEYRGSLLYLVLAGLVFGLINLLVKPIATFFSFPLIILTLGLFFLVINAAMLKLADVFLRDFDVHGFWAAVLGGIVIALFNWVVRAFSAD
jgi:putative membrane protein